MSFWSLLLRKTGFLTPDGFFHVEVAPLSQTHQALSIPFLWICNFKNCIYFRLCWVFVIARGPPLLVVQWASHCDASCCRPRSSRVPRLQVRTGLSGCGLRGPRADSVKGVQDHLPQARNPLRPRIEATSLHWQADSAPWATREVWDLRFLEEEPGHE